MTPRSILMVKECHRPCHVYLLVILYIFKFLYFIVMFFHVCWLHMWWFSTTETKIVVYTDNGLCFSSLFFHRDDAYNALYVCMCAGNNTAVTENHLVDAGNRTGVYTDDMIVDTTRKGPLAISKALLYNRWKVLINKDNNSCL